jgi:hypothetical protein
MVVLILAGLWAFVLVPPWLRNRSEGRPADSISSFRHQLSVLQRSNPTHPHAFHGRPVMPFAMTRAAARRRRRDVLFVLAAAAVITLALGALLGGVVLYVNFVIDAMLVAYVVLLARAQRLAIERDMKVRYLPQRAGSPEPALLLRRTGN